MTETTPHESGVDGRAIAKRAAFFVVVRRSRPWSGSARCRASTRCATASPGADPRLARRASRCARSTSMLGFVRALWAVFDRVMPWRRALVLGLAEQGANVLLPAGGAGGPAFGAFVMRRVGVPAELADQPPRGAVPATSAVSFVALVVAGTLAWRSACCPGDAPLVGDAAARGRRRGRDRARPSFRAQRRRRRRARRRAVPHGALARCGASSTTACGRRVDLLRHGDPLLIFGAVTLLRVRRRGLGVRVPGLRRRRPAGRDLHPRLHARPRRRAPADARAASAGPRAA